MGSVGQNGGNLILTAARVGGGAGVAAASVASTSPSTCMVGSSVVAMGDCRERVVCGVDGVSWASRVTSWSPM